MIGYKEIKQLCFRVAQAHGLPLAKVHETVAQSLGHRDWNTFAALAKGASEAPVAAVPETPAQELARLEAEFAANGGRGVTLAERIDELRLIVAMEGVAPEELHPRATAETHDDNREFEVPEFDCTLWFAQASDAELLALILCGFGGDYGADAVAEFYDGLEPRVTRMFERKRSGFECHVDRQQAMAWLRAHRPLLLADFSADEE